MSPDHASGLVVNAEERLRHPVPVRIRPTTITCAWCGTAVKVRPTGRIPTWCSTSCRHRAWEQRRAAASGLAAVQVVERIVEVAVPTEDIQRPGVLVGTPRGAAWGPTLVELSRQIRSGELSDSALVPVLAGARLLMHFLADAGLSLEPIDVKTAIAMATQTEPAPDPTEPTYRRRSSSRRDRRRRR